MKNIIIFTTIVALAIFSGCSDSKQKTTTDSQEALRLKTEKAQIVQELESTRKELNKQIAQRDEKIKELEDEIAMLKQQTTGFEGIVSQMLEKYQEIAKDVKAAKEENERLKAELKASNPPVSSSKELEPNAQKRLDALKSLKKND